MKLKLSYDSLEDIPEKFRELFTEKDEKWSFSGVDGMRTNDDVTRLEAALSKERKDHKKVKDDLKNKFGDLDAEQVRADLDELAELRLKVTENPEGKKTDELVEQRVKVRLAPIERERDKLKNDVLTLTNERGELASTISRGKIEGHLRKAADGAKIVGTAIEDVIAIGGNLFELNDDGQAVAKENAGLQPGLTPDIWMTDQKEKRPHWWPASEGGGAKGAKDGSGGGNNPWSKGAWNVTQQSQYVRTHGTAKANAMASAAGVTVGATAPATKH